MSLFSLFFSLKKKFPLDSHRSFVLSEQQLKMKLSIMQGLYMCTFWSDSHILVLISIPRGLNNSSSFYKHPYTCQRTLMLWRLKTLHPSLHLEAWLCVRCGLLEKGESFSVVVPSDTVVMLNITVIIPEEEEPGFHQISVHLSSVFASRPAQGGKGCDLQP